MDLKVIYLPEAYEFMLNINSAASEKLAYNVRKVRMGIKDKNIFKKLTGTEFGSSVHYTTAIVTDFCHFGIPATKR